MNCIIHTSAFALNRKTQQTNILFFFFFLLSERDLLNLTEIDAAGKKTSSCSRRCVFGPDVTALGY